MIKGKELFGDKGLTLADGKVYTLKFTFRSLAELEEKKNNDYQAVFDMFDKSFNSKNMMLGLWSCLISENKELRALSDEEIYDKMMDLIDDETYLVVKLAVIEQFAKFWNKAKESKQLPEEYRKVLDEFEQKGSKKK